MGSSADFAVPPTPRPATKNLAQPPKICGARAAWSGAHEQDGDVRFTSENRHRPSALRCSLNADQLYLVGACTGTAVNNVVALNFERVLDDLCGASRRGS
jgi:hypothetical protein